ncbi:12-oxophytodienoate reductase [Salvia divinorum]|uniref:COX assembly mitochondrial protein n=1 Tax=Salvia divinorum TaxID=28513 RepID=A0ABD1HYT0_SALDI
MLLHSSSVRVEPSLLGGAFPPSRPFSSLSRFTLSVSLVFSDTQIVKRYKMHPPLTIHRHPMCAEIIELFQKCHTDHPLGKFFGECTDLKIKLDKCFRQEKSLKRKANFEESKKLKERLREYRIQNSETME